MSAREVKFWILKVLGAAQGEPMPDRVLRANVRLAFPRGAFSDTELSAWLEETEREGWAACVTDPILGPQWTLTLKGQAKALQLS